MDLLECNITRNRDIWQQLEQNRFTGSETNRQLGTNILSRVPNLMRTVLASTTVLLTIVLSLSFGIACGYAVIFGILHSFGHRPAKAESAPATAVIVTSAGSH